MITAKDFEKLRCKLTQKGVVLVAVSKTRSIEDIRHLYNFGQRDFGENYVQELLPKYKALPKDIRWHFIGHLQVNKVKYVAPFIHLIQSVDSLKLLTEINKQAAKSKRVTDCLLEIKIGQEITKTGMDIEKVPVIFTSSELESLRNIKITGLMGIASNTNSQVLISKEFALLKNQFDIYKDKYPSLSVLSMGMTHDYEVAILAGSTMVRLGTLLFGSR